MIRLLGFSVVSATLAAALLLQLDATPRLVAWEVLLLLLLLVLWRLFPPVERDPTPPLFGTSVVDREHPPRSVSSFELAAVHAMSESPGADRRLKVLMRRVANHRLRQGGIRPESPRSAEIVDPVLFRDGLQPLTGTQIERIVDQLERM